MAWLWKSGGLPCFFFIPNYFTALHFNFLLCICVCVCMHVLSTHKEGVPLTVVSLHLWKCPAFIVGISGSHHINFQLFSAVPQRGLDWVPQNFRCLKQHKSLLWFWPSQIYFGLCLMFSSPEIPADPIYGHSFCKGKNSEYFLMGSHLMEFFPEPVYILASYLVNKL